MRPDETIARGTMTNMKTVIITAIRICMTYCRKATRFPMGISPLATRMLAEPQDRDRREVEDGHQQRDHQREQPVDLERRRGEVAVGDVEALLLVRRPDEGPDDANAAQGLAGDLVDAVDLDLDELEQRQGARHQQPDDEGHDRQDHDQDRRQRDVLTEGHDDPADRQDRRDDHHVEADQDDHLDLLDVVGVAGDERRRSRTG